MGTLSGTASAVIEAPIEVVWAVVADVESAPAWQGGFEGVTAHEPDGHRPATTSDTHTHKRVKRFTARVSFAYEPPHRLAWRQEHGDLKAMHGSWLLHDLGAGRTRATYALHADPGALLARFVKGALEAKLREELIEDRPVELKARAEGL
jgi:carbon monoxide dehydrogenase subunit G